MKNTKNRNDKRGLHRSRMLQKLWDAGVDVIPSDPDERLYEVTVEVKRHFAAVRSEWSKRGVDCKCDLTNSECLCFDDGQACERAVLDDLIKATANQTRALLKAIWKEVKGQVKFPSIWKIREVATQMAAAMESRKQPGT